MSENLIIAEGGKRERYEMLWCQVVAVVEHESDDIANMANVAAMIHATFNFWWTDSIGSSARSWCWGHFKDPWRAVV